MGVRPEPILRGRIFLGRREVLKDPGLSAAQMFTMRIVRVNLLAALLDPRARERAGRLLPDRRRALGATPAPSGSSSSSIIIWFVMSITTNIIS